MLRLQTGVTTVTRRWTMLLEDLMLRKNSVCDPLLPFSVRSRLSTWLAYRCALH